MSYCTGADSGACLFRVGDTSHKAVDEPQLGRVWRQDCCKVCSIRASILRAGSHQPSQRSADKHGQLAYPGLDRCRPGKAWSIMDLQLMQLIHVIT